MADGVKPKPEHEVDPVRSTLDDRFSLASEELAELAFRDDFRDALIKSALYTTPAVKRPFRPPQPPTLTDFQDTELIMEMLRRGYAVLKCPAPGEPPETLKDG